ncbi:MAG TPA: BON domain-containing protein [Thermomonas sp.]|nr:BON domain-containing protein [Thermomonas sp.]
MGHVRLCLMAHGQPPAAQRPARLPHRPDASKPVAPKEIRMNTQNKLTSLTLTCVFLFGNGAALAHPLHATAQASGKSSSAPQAVDDAWITTKVKAELATTKGVAASDVSVTTADGRVTLTGVLATKTAVNKAVATTQGIKGVKSVDAAGLKVGTPAKVKPSDATSEHSADAGQAVNDAWITTKVKSELATTAGVPASDVTVQTVDGVVTLTGSLDGELAMKKAVAAARSVKGVKQVDDSGLSFRH